MAGDAPERLAGDVTGEGTDVAVVVVDAANVVGSRPDGWWRDRAGAAGRLLAALARLPGRIVAGPDGAPLTVVRVVAVVEGRARDAVDPAAPSLDVVRAPADGDTAVVGAVAAALDGGRPTSGVLVVTADRGLRDRLPAGVTAIGPRWLLGLLDG